MKRNSFIITLLGLTAAPLAFGIQNEKRSPSERVGFKTDAGEGRIHGHIRLKGINSNILDLKVSGKDTNGDLAIFEQTSISQGKGTPLHVHYFQDEVFYVIDGEYYFQVGDSKHRLKSGNYIFLPRKVPHAWTQVSEKGKMTVTFQPAGKMEEFFLTMSGLKDDPTAEEIARIFAESEMKVVGPPLKIT
jgi:quercetin dioxygenase-like cupin family protein